MPGTQQGKVSLLVPANAAGPDHPPYSATFGYDKRIATIVGARNTTIDGPDLAWLPLTQEQARSLGDSAHSRAVFYNLTTGLRAYDSFKAQGQREGPTNGEQYLRQHLYMAVGWNHEIHARSGGVRGGIWMNEVLPETVTAANGWAYADYRINDDSWLEQNYSDGTKLPATWQGLSGGSLWHVWRPDPSRPDFEKMLVGVPFYEIRQSAKRSMTIRTHHDLSLVRLLHKAGIAPHGAITDEEIVKGLRTLPVPSQAGSCEP